MTQDIKINFHFAQAVAPTTAAAVEETLRPLLGQLHAAGGIYQGDVLAVAGKKFRVASRCWFLNDGDRLLELTLVQV